MAGYTSRIDLWLPWPPSVNHTTFAKGGRKIMSPKTREWFEEAAAHITANKVPSIKGPVQIDIVLVAPTKRRFDIDNKLKALLDALVKSGVIEDDDCRFVKEISIRAYAVGENPGAYLTIESIPLVAGFTA